MTTVICLGNVHGRVHLVPEPCNTELWKKQNTQHGKKWVPQCLYTTQSFDAWLKFFLSRKVIEDSLKSTSSQRNNRAFAPFNSDMAECTRLSCMEGYSWTEDSPYNLTFGIYIDWFNPFTNKIAGKQIMLLLSKQIFKTIL